MTLGPQAGSPRRMRDGPTWHASPWKNGKSLHGLLAFRAT